MDNFHKYFPISQEEELWGLYTLTCGYYQSPPGKPYPPLRAHPTDHHLTWKYGRTLQGYYIVYITQGKGFFQSDNTEIKIIEAGTTFLLYPGVWHRYQPDPATGWEEYWVGFKGSYPQQLMQQRFFNAQSPLIRVGQNEAMLQLFLQLIELAKEENIGYQQVMSGVIIQLLGQMYTIQKSSGLGSETEQLIKEAKFAMLSHMDTPVDGKQLSDQLNVSYSWFRKVFKQYTGLPPAQYQMQIRLQKAQELLASSSLTVKEIAYQLGFNSRFYFTRLFTKKTGITPTAFRAKARGHRQ